MSSPIRMVVGLGNPGPHYAVTRHNAGFWFVGALAARMGAQFRPASRFFGEISELSVDAERLHLLKPNTFMNRSGQAVAALARFYQYSPEQILVAHDEIDLPPGTVRLKRGGGHGGHKGLRDIITHLGVANFVRLRIGVGHPGSSDEVIEYVLRRAPAEEESLIERSIDSALQVFPRLVAGDLDRAMNELHRKPPNDQRSPMTKNTKSQETESAETRETKTGVSEETKNDSG